MKKDLKNLSLDQIKDLVTSLAMEPYRAKQISEWVFKHNVPTIDEITTLSKQMRKKLNHVASISTLIPENINTSRDGSKKFLFKTSDNYGIESVLLKEKKHWTLCISTQVGCPMACRFCYSGSKGLIRNLTPAEIINQVSAVLKNQNFHEKLPNLVFMGMGEPLANYENTLQSLRILLSPWGFNFSHRKITLSTAGLIPQIRRLAQDVPLNLAISLNAPNDEIRSLLMPVNKKFPLKELIEAAKNFPIAPRKRITFEYILIKGINDAGDHAVKLAGLLQDVPCKINLIPFNEYPGSCFKRPDETKVRQFQSILHRHYFTAPLRESKGADITAACGQLGASLQGGTVKSQ